MLKVHIFEGSLLPLQITSLLVEKRSTCLSEVSIHSLDSIVIVTETVVLSCVCFLKAPSDFACEALELYLKGHALSYCVRVIDGSKDLLLVAFTLTHHTWLERLKGPKATFTAALPQ